MKKLGLLNLLFLVSVIFVTFAFPISVHAEFVYPLQEEHITDLVAGTSYSIVLSTDGSVYSWGSGGFGSLGQGSQNSDTFFIKPREMTHLFTGLSETDKIISVSTSSRHSAAISSEGQVFVWGPNFYSVMTTETSNHQYLPLNITDRFIGLSIGEKMIMIEPGDDFYMALSSEGKVFTWGRNNYGQLGDNTTTNQVLPINITNSISLSEGDKIVKIGAGMHSSYALSQSGRMFAWGANFSGQIGDNSTTNRLLPVEITSFFPSLDPQEGIKDFAPGVIHVIAYTTLNKVFTWCSNTNGQLGDNTLENKLTPQNITNAFAYSWWLPFNIKAIEAGYHTTFIVIGDDYRLFAFGRNLYGVLSDGTQIDRHTPREISIFHNSIRIHVSGIGTGDGHTLFQSTNGRLFGVGRNFEGQIGDNTRIDRINPIRLFAPDYTITFDSQGGNAVDSITTYEGGPVTMPQDPVKPGFVFKGWFGSPNPPSFHTKVVYTVMPYQSVALYAVWSPDRYALIFRDSQNEIIQSTDYLINADLSAVIPPTAPEKTGYSFTGWSIDIPPTMPTQDVYIDAQYTKNSYTITFETNGGTSITPLVTPYQNWVFIQNTPSRVGYTFGGWFTDESLTIPYVDAHQPAYNFTLYAKWNGTQFQLIYRDHDQQILQSTTYNVGANLGSHVAPIPTRVGYTFTGWSQSVPSTMPSQDVTLTAQWTINQYTITFNSTGGSAVSSITQNYHSAITSPANPTRVGYTFTGWSPIVPTNMPAENLTLSAQWSINQYTITFNTNGGSAVASITQDYNSVVNTPINPTKEGYVFNGWSQSIPSTMPASHLEIQAYWILNTQDSGAFQTQTDAIHDLIDPSMIEGKNVEIIIRVEVKPQVNILPSEIDIVNQVVKDTLQIQNYGSVFINIEIILKEAGLDDVLIQELLEPLAITISIPQEYQGFRNYRVIRIHNGEAVVLETQYHHVDQTLTFLTDRFSTYVITYDLTSGFSIWWLLLLLLVPAGYFIYLQTKKIRLVKQEAHSSDHVEVSSSNEEKKEVVVYDEVMIHKVEERPQFLAFETVQNGEYLEVTKVLEATSRVVEVSTGVLPKLINTENRFVSLSKKEAKQFKETSSHLDSYQLLTPGSYTDSGYFMEVDTNKKAVHNYIYTKKRLPPTSAVGHCWVRVEPRKIKTE